MNSILVTAAENTFIGIEHLTEEEVNEFQKSAKQRRKEQKKPDILPSKKLVPKQERPRIRPCSWQMHQGQRFVPCWIPLGQFSVIVSIRID